MKIFKINTVYGFGSTGRSVREIGEMLLLQGHDYYVAYGQLTCDFENSFKIGSKFENHIHNALSRITGKQGYYTKKGTNELINYIKVFDPDIIHLGNLHGNYLNFKILFNYLAIANKPVVWTLHDCWSFTGKCTHYTDIGCYKWQTHCHHCPQVKKYPPSIFFDRSSKMFADKKKWFTSVKDMTIITVSKWLEDEVKKSYLSTFPIVSIYNWVDHSVFRPQSGNLKEKYGFDKNEFIILVVSAGWNKKDSKFKDLINLSKLIADDMKIVMVGKLIGKQKLPNNISYIPYIHDISTMAEIYSMADVYVHLSVEDTFGKVIAEALSCGTPSIVYNSTACPELIGKGCGFVVEKKNVTAIYAAIQQIKTDGKISYSEKCRQYVQNNFDYSENIEKIIQLYKSILN
jgi:putative colanic acid biosynthesis glycosyltransferase